MAVFENSRQSMSDDVHPTKYGEDPMATAVGIAKIIPSDLHNHHRLQCCSQEILKGKKNDECLGDCRTFIANSIKSMADDNKRIITRLTEEVVCLRREVRGVNKLLTRIEESSGLDPKPPSFRNFPCITKEEFMAFEHEIQNLTSCEVHVSSV